MCCGDRLSSPSKAVITKGNLFEHGVSPLGKKAHAIARVLGLQGHNACEEFYVLALECGVWHSYAEHIRDAVKQVR